MAASLSMPPRDKCPGCHSAIYDGARAQGWCTDCMPPEIDVLCTRLAKPRRFSDVLSFAVAEALGTRSYVDQFAAEDMTAERWFAMYHGQCMATDEFAKRAAAKSDKALLDRIADLEAQIAKLNRRLALINDAHDLAHAAI
jgi:uncharacterized protein YceH (UPF0502 family)